MGESITVGIDLGTTNTLACCRKPNGKLKIINIDHNEMLPSALYVDDEGRKVGGEALQEGIIHPENLLIRSSKTYMGSGKTWSFGSETFTPTDVAVEILKKVRAAVLKWKKCPEDTEIQAVITYPQSFNLRQTEATREAGRRAGFRMLPLLPEPTAAALCVAQEADDIEDDELVLVVDLGGGTFDLCVLKADPVQHSYNAVTGSGDRNLGGDDFDKALYDNLVQRIREDYGIDLTSETASGLDEGTYRRACAKLGEAAQRAKLDLTPKKETRINLATILPPGVLPEGGYPVERIEREEFEDICRPLFEKIADCLETFLVTNEQAGQFHRSDISRVILAGGSCYIPKIQQDVSRIVGKPAVVGSKLDKLVACGACWYANYKAGGIDAEQAGGFYSHRGVVEHTLGVAVDHETHFSPIIQKNRPFPTTETRLYVTDRVGQTKTDVKVYEAKSDAEGAKDIGAYEYCATLHLEGLRPDAAGRPSINVTFAYDEDRCLTVTAEDIVSHQKKELTIDWTAAQGMQGGDGLHAASGDIDFVLLMDASYSMEGQPLTDAKAASRRLVNDMIDFSHHRMGLVAFGSMAYELVPITSDIMQLARGINSIHADGGTEMMKAFDRAEQMFDEKSGGRTRIVVMVSDGVPFESDEDDTIACARALRSRGVRIVFIGVGNSEHGEMIGRHLASEGDSYRIANMSQLADTFQTVIDGICDPSEGHMA